MKTHYRFFIQMMLAGLLFFSGFSTHAANISVGVYMGAPFMTPSTLVYTPVPVIYHTPVVYVPHAVPAYVPVPAVYRHGAAVRRPAYGRASYPKRRVYHHQR